MPPRDPRLCPDLERALPRDDVPGTARVLEWPERWEVQFGEHDENGDPVWHAVSVRARARDKHGRETFCAEWHAGGSTWQEWYVSDPEKIRPTA